VVTGQDRTGILHNLQNSPGPTGPMGPTCLEIYIRYNLKKCFVQICTNIDTQEKEKRKRRNATRQICAPRILKKICMSKSNSKSTTNPPKAIQNAPHPYRPYPSAEVADMGTADLGVVGSSSLLMVRDIVAPDRSSRSRVMSPGRMPLPA
jgi:hypothetical protein